MSGEKSLRQFNVVFHFKVPVERSFPPRGLDTEGFSARIFHNFAVLRREKVTFTVFFQSGHVNSSGTKTFDDVGDTVAVANKLFDTSLAERDITITSSTWSGNYDHHLLNIPSTKDVLFQRKKDVRVSLRPSRFPGAVVRQVGRPTIILFRNGKYVVVGGKSTESVKDTVEGIAPNLRCLCCR